MSAGLLYALGGAVVLVLGLGGAIVCGSLVRRVLAFNIMSSGVFLMLIGLGQRSGHADPVPQAMVLTGIVVTVAGTALALVLARRIRQEEDSEAGSKGGGRRGSGSGETADVVPSRGPDGSGEGAA